ncbi:MAG: hypothetical protein AAF531_09735 [Actinomycetota bacterium]
MAIRKAAALVHWVPGISLLVYQTDWPPLLVACAPQSPADGEVWMQLTPCQFRNELAQLPDGSSDLVGPSLCDEDADLRIDLVTDGSTMIDGAGLFSMPNGHDQRSIGFVTLAAVPFCDPRPPTRSCLGRALRSTEGLGLTTVVDEALGVRLVSCSFPESDAVRGDRANAIMFDALLQASVEEITLLARHE